jgi:hypothetical protein
MAEKKYKRLTRERGSSVLGKLAISRSSLWLGEDHLLLVEGSGYSETYKRFFFRDIQVLTFHKTKSRLAWNCILAPLLALSAVIIAAASSDWPTKATIIVSIIVFVIFGIPLLLNNLFGPGCAGEIRTAVQTESFPSLSRVRKTQKIMNRIRPLIIAAQGQLTGEEVSARMRESAFTPAAAVESFSGDIPPVIS